MVTATRLRFPTEYEKFVDQNSWLFVEDNQRAALADRWLKAEVIFVTDGVVKAPAGEYFVQSQGSAATQYRVTTGSYPTSVENACTCTDFAKSQEQNAKNGAPHGWCKHRLSVWLAQERSSSQAVKAHSNLPQKRQESTMGTTEFPYSFTVKHQLNGFDELITIRGMELKAVLTERQSVLEALIIKRSAAKDTPGELRSPDPSASGPQLVTASKVPTCPECGEQGTWKEGNRKSDSKHYAFWKCENCDQPIPIKKTKAA